MASIWQVSTPSGLNIRSGPGTNYGKVRAAFTNGTQVSSENDERATGEDGYGNEWVHVTSPVDGWMCKSYMTCLQEHTVEEKTETIDETNSTPETVEYNESGYENYSVGQSDAAVNDGYLKFMKALGSPIQFTDYADPPVYQSDDKIYRTCGRTYAETILRNPTVLSICPGKVHYLPNFTDKDRNTFAELIQAKIQGDEGLLERFQDDGNKLSGKLYEFLSDYAEYINVVNYMCRLCAILQGIGDICMPGSNVPLKQFDYAYFTTAGGNPTMDSDSKSIFGISSELKKGIDSAVSDNQYIHFFLTQSGTSFSEEISTSTGSSFFEETINGSGLDSAARNLQFLTGGSLEVDQNMTADIESIFNGASSSWIKTFGSLASNYYKGGRMVFPQMLEGCTYGKSISCSMHFSSLYGHPVSRFLRCIVPACHLLAMAFPQQIADNMYSYPFLCRIYQPGWFNSDLAVISNMNLKWGGSDDTAWTVDSLSTDLEVSFDVTPLYMQMMSSSAAHPWRAMNNTALIEYLGNMCGVDLKLNNLGAKLEIAGNMIYNTTMGIPTNVARGVGGKVGNYLEKVFKWFEE